MRWFAFVLFALMVAITSTSTAADWESCIPVLEAAETHRKTIEPAQTAFERAEARARATRDKAKGDAAIVLDNLRRETLAAGQEWHYSEAEAEAREIYNKAIRQADAVYNSSLVTSRAALNIAKEVADAVLLVAVRNAWTGPTSDNPRISAAILAKFLHDCLALLVGDLEY